MAGQRRYISELRNHIDSIMRVSDEAFGLIEPAVSLRKVAKGELIVEQDKRPSCVCCIRRGIFRSFVEEDGIDRTRWFGIEGDFITSTFSLGTGMPANSSIEAIVKGEVWELDFSQAKEIINENPEWTKWMMTMLLLGLGSWEKRDRMMCASDAYTRFKSFYTLKAMEVLSQIPLQHIASYLHVTPQTVSHCRRRLVEDIKAGKI